MKKIVLGILGFLVASCGLNAHANSTCGDPTKGSFTCDADQISVEFDFDNISRSRLYELDSSSGYSDHGYYASLSFYGAPIKSITSPSININSMGGAFRYKHVTASFPFRNHLFDCYGCRNYQNSNAYTVELIARDKNGNDIVIDSRSATVTGEYRYAYPALYSLSAINNGFLSTYGEGAVILAGNVDDSYNEFRFRIKNINLPTRVYLGSDSLIKTNLFDMLRNKKINLNVVGYN